MQFFFCYFEYLLVLILITCKLQENHIQLWWNICWNVRMPNLQWTEQFSRLQCEGADDYTVVTSRITMPCSFSPVSECFSSGADRALGSDLALGMRRAAGLAICARSAYFWRVPAHSPQVTGFIQRAGRHVFLCRRRRARLNDTWPPVRGGHHSWRLQSSAMDRKELTAS